jgi:hypothetical protein
MSAAAGISAAKKRRGVVSTGPEVSSTPSSKSGSGQASPMVTPIQILQNHELRIKLIEKQLSDAENYATSMMEHEPHFQPPQPQQQVQQPQQQQVHQQHQDNVLLQEYKHKCDTLEKKVDELSHLVQKVQTFSMESNLALLKLKRTFDEDFEGRLRELKQNYVSHDNMIQSIKLETAAALSDMIKPSNAVAALSAVTSFSQFDSSE